MSLKGRCISSGQDGSTGVREEMPMKKLAVKYIFANVLAVAPSAAMPAIPLDQRMPDYSLALFAYGYQY